MHPNDAILLLVGGMTRDQAQAAVAAHPKTEDCPDLECLVCAVRDCPHAEPLHYHHDGCPACWQHEQATP